MAKRSGGELTTKIKTLESHTITVSDRTFVIKPGDNVMMQNPKYLKEPNYVAKIVKIFPTTRTNPDVRVKIYWYYRPLNVLSGFNVFFHRTHELFSSDHVDTQSVDTIIKKCNVYTMNVLKKLDNVEFENDFYCCFKYHCLTRTFSPDNAMVNCKCEMRVYNPERKLLQDCEECGDRFHPACVGMTRKMVNQVEHFFCGPCSAKKDDAESSNARYTI